VGAIASPSSTPNATSRTTANVPDRRTAKFMPIRQAKAAMNQMKAQP
jgi:hypothetical protein